MPNPINRVLRSKRRAFTSIELLAAAFILVLLVVAALSLFGTGSTLYAQTSRQAFTESDIANASRVIESELSQACNYNVKSDGTQLSYTVLQPTNSTNPWSPQRDTTVRNFQVKLVNGANVLIWTDATGNPRTRPLATGLTSTAVFGPTDTASAHPSGATPSILIATLTSQQSYSVGKGSLRNAQQTMVVRVRPRNVAPIFNTVQSQPFPALAFRP